MTDAVRVSVNNGELYFDTYTEDEANAIIEYVKMVDRPLNVEVGRDGSCTVSGDELGILLLLSKFTKIEVQL